MMDNKKAKAQSYFFFEMKHVSKPPRQWMVEMLDVLCQHYPKEDLRYLLNTTSPSHFQTSVQLLVDYGHVDFLCVDLCNAHVHRNCECPTVAVDCLSPHL